MNRLRTMKPAARQNLISYTLVTAAYLVIRLLQGQGMLSRSIQGQLVPICCYIVMALSLNLVVGISGELSLGHAGFMSVGAFSGVAAAVSLESGGVGSPAVRLVAAMAVGAVLAAAAGFIVGVPALRLQGDYLAIVTLAFGQIIVNILQCVYLGVDAGGLHFNFLDAELHMEDGISIISGPKGTVSVTRIASFTAGFLLILVTLAVVQNLVNSRAGRAIMAARDNRIAAGSVGVNVTKYKLMAFVTAAALPCSAAAPRILYIGIAPASPRRSSSAASSPAEMSSWVIIDLTLIPIRSASCLAILPLITSPEWLRIRSKIPASRLNICKAWNNRCAPGAAKISPTTEASSIPSPTNPLTAGSCPDPPKATMATLSSAFGWVRTTIFSAPSFTVSAKAIVYPSNNSAVIFSVEFMNLFIVWNILSVKTSFI